MTRATGIAADRSGRSSTLRLAVTYANSDEALREQAISLSHALQIPMVEAEEQANRFDFTIRVTATRWELRSGDLRGPGPVFVDFVHGATAHRASSATLRREPLASAIGVRRGVQTVIDATAGLARDAFVIASVGCHVTMVERHPILAALIHNALERGLQRKTRSEQTVGRMSLIVDDARQVLKACTEENAPDAVYIDPMFAPTVKKRAKAKKEMQICRKLAGDDHDAAELLAMARGVALHRVVVKRHRHASPLALNPDFKCAGKQVRYDVYLTTR